MEITTITWNTSKEKGRSQDFIVTESAIKRIKFYFMVIYFIAIVLDIEKLNANTLQGNKDWCWGMKTNVDFLLMLNVSSVVILTPRH